MKIHSLFIILLFTQVSFGQELKIPFPGVFFGTNEIVDTLYITNSAGNVGNSGSLIDTFAPHLNENSNWLTNEQMAERKFATTPLEKQLRARSGEPTTLTFRFKLHKDLGSTYFNSDPKISLNAGQLPFENANTITGTKGQEDYTFVNQAQDLSFQSTNYNSSTQIQEIVYSSTVNFPMGRLKSWIVLSFAVWKDNGYNILTAGYYYVVLPFVVEGPMITPSQANPVAIKGYIREPAIPQFILHNPPGDMSSVTFQTNQEACRSMSESLTTDETNNGKLDVTLGIAGSAGLFVSVNYEFSVTASLSGGGGSTLMKSSGKQNCVSVLNAISTVPGNARANEGSIYIGYSSDIAYGMFPIVTINTTPTISVVRDSSVIFGLVPGSATPFYYTKNDILNDISLNRAIMNNMTNTPKMRHQAQSQIKIWEQVLKKDSINIKDPTAPVIEAPFTLGSGQSRTTSVTQSITTTDTYEVSHFLELGAGVSFVVKVGGSGVAGGYEFKTKKTRGASVSNSNNSSTTIAYTLQDDDAGDSFRIKIVKDKSYGTPIFLMDEALTRTSCPYEGGYQRDQPRLEINNSTSPIITVSDVSLGTSGNFRVKVCNNSNEIRDYGFGFIGESIVNDVSITSTAGIGSSPTGTSITKLATITAIPANGCKTTTYDVNISRRNPASPMSYQNIEFVTYAECEPSIKSSIFANINFAGPQPPTGVSASKNEACTGTPVTLTANCPVATTPTWYTVSEGGFPIAIGPSVVVNPTVNTTYYVGCETPDYKRDRVATQLVLVGTPSTVLNLTTNFTTNTLQIANTTISANNKIFSPASVTYKAGNSLTFSPGFEAKSGSNFIARIGGCGN